MEKEPRQYFPGTLGLRMLIVGLILGVAGFFANWALFASGNSEIGLISFLMWVVGLILIPVGAVVTLVQYLNKPVVVAQPPPPPSNPAAGWLPDPTDTTILRYWDGTQWTGQTARRDES